MLLQDKVAVIYGAGGAIGGAVARAVAREGPGCFSPATTGHRSTRSPRTSSPPAEPPRPRLVDALDEQAIDQHLQSVVDQAGHLDISLNAAGIPDTQLLGCRWSSWTSSGSACRSRPTPGRTS